MLVSQPSRFDAGRAPAGRHILWTYCHVPAGSTVDMSDAVMAQLERFAPGFRDVVKDMAVFSVSRSNIVTVEEYIRRQKEHHRKQDFKNEFRGLLKTLN